MQLYFFFFPVFKEEICYDPEVKFVFLLLEEGCYYNKILRSVSEFLRCTTLM